MAADLLTIFNRHIPFLYGLSHNPLTMASLPARIQQLHQRKSQFFDGCFNYLTNLGLDQ